MLSDHLFKWFIESDEEKRIENSYKTQELFK